MPGNPERNDCQPTLGVRIFRLFVRPLFRMIFRLTCRVEVEGLENVPRQGSYLVTANHLSIFDGPFLVAFWPVPLEVAGAAEARTVPFQGPLLRGYGIMPVHRGEADRRVLERMLACLQAGRPVFIAPEGTRSHIAGMQAGKPGAAYVAGKARVPVVPVGITGAEIVSQSWRQWVRPRLRMSIGKPYQLPAVPWSNPARKVVLKENTRLIMEALARQLPEQYHGLYRRAGLGQAD